MIALSVVIRSHERELAALECPLSSKILLVVKTAWTLSILAMTSQTQALIVSSIVSGIDLRAYSQLLRGRDTQALGQQLFLH
jgi:hypothetical protein